jgi:hypothetical protein
MGFERQRKEECDMSKKRIREMITSTAIAYVPAKLVNCPSNFVKMNKPVCFFHTRDNSLQKSRMTINDTT